MRKPKVTKGKWFVRMSNYADFTGKFSEWPICIASESGSGLAEIHAKSELKDKECLANAHLMAAAPEMLEALLELKKLTDKMCKMAEKDLGLGLLGGKYGSKIESALKKAGVK